VTGTTSEVKPSLVKAASTGTKGRPRCGGDDWDENREDCGPENRENSENPEDGGRENRENWENPRKEEPRPNCGAVSAHAQSSSRRAAVTFILAPDFQLLTAY